MKTPLQEKLEELGSPEKLKEELGINHYRHPDLPLIGFKYSQIDSPKTNPVVRWSRGTVLVDGTWELVAQPFVRFYNFGEGGQDDLGSFDWSDFNCYTKEDGSLIIIYWYDGEWHANTSGSFGLGAINKDTDRSWRDIVWNEAAGVDRSRLDRDFTYVFELTSPWNKVVRKYDDTRLVMLGAFRGPTELRHDEMIALALDSGCDVADSHKIGTRRELEELLFRKEEEDPTFEGFVVRDKNGLRYKFKSKTYLGLTHLYCNGNFIPRRFLPFILSGETDEVLAYFPEVESHLMSAKERVDSEYARLASVWRDNHQIKEQKEFALAIQGKTRFSSLLFRLRKAKGKGQTESDLRALWRKSEDLIARAMFK